jgi:hypothetical protein
MITGQHSRSGCLVMVSHSVPRPPASPAVVGDHTPPHKPPTKKSTLRPKITQKRQQKSTKHTTRKKTAISRTAKPSAPSFIGSGEEPTRTRTGDPQVYGEPTCRLGYGGFCCLYEELGNYEPPSPLSCRCSNHSSLSSSTSCREAHKDPQYDIQIPRWHSYRPEMGARVRPSAVRTRLFVEAS